MDTIIRRWPAPTQFAPSPPSGMCRTSMEFCSFTAPAPDLVVATAIHNGHDLRPELAALITLDEATRLREEDPHTGLVASRFGISAVVHRSRFEVDLNRERERALYQTSDEAWGLEVWNGSLTEEHVDESLRLYEAFYDVLTSILDSLVSQVGGFVLYDLHSYNHRRAGPDSQPEPIAENPTVNLGTGSLPAVWRGVADTFVEAMRSSAVDGVGLDVRENVRFRGGHLARWVNGKYGDHGCALAIELKKVFIDEWTGALDAERLDRLGDALLASVGPVTAKFVDR